MNNNEISPMNIIVKMKFGSELYGTVTETSDTDIKGVFIPDWETILLGTSPKVLNYNIKESHTLKNQKGDVDIELYSLHQFIKLANEGQTVALDMLHVPDNMLLQTSQIWKHIVSEKHRFYTKNLKAFVGYARKQSFKYSIKGNRLSDSKRVVEFLESMINEKNNILEKTIAGVWGFLPEGEHISKFYNPKNGLLEYEVCGKKVQETVTWEYALNVFKRYYEAYGKRAELAAKNEGIDWKSVSHAIRAATEVKQLLTEKTITFPLSNAEYLIKVKKGELDYLTEVGPVLESMMEELEILTEESDLPNRSDVRYWRQFIIDTIMKFYIFKNYILKDNVQI